MGRRQAFSLVEVLVVIAIISVLMALLLPAVQRVRAAVDRMRCANNLRQLALGLHHYHNDYDRFPPAFAATPGRWGWGVFVLPYIEEDAAYRQVHFDYDWNHPINQPAAGKAIRVMECPTAGSSGQRMNAVDGLSFGLCDYSPIFDVDPDLIATGLVPLSTGNPLGIMEWNGARIADIHDGPSHTILLAEVAGRPEWYRKGQHVGQTDIAGWASHNGITPINLDGTSPDGETFFGPCAVNCTNLHEVYSFHPLGANAAFGDGRVVFLKQTISIQVMAALVTRAGGEPITADEID